MQEWLKASDPSDVVEFYDRKYRQSGKEAFKGAPHDYFFRTFEDIFKSPRPTDRLLDCGCGHGEFFERVFSHYKFSAPHMTGIDVSSVAIGLAKDKFKNYEYEVRFFNNSMENPLQFEIGNFVQYDIVTCWGSIEHTFSPRRALERMLEATKSGGLVMITVPLEFEGCLTHIQNEEFQNNNERFMKYEEWVRYFSEVKKPIMTRNVDFPETGDLFLVFRK